MKFYVYYNYDFGSSHGLETFTNELAALTFICESINDDGAEKLENFRMVEGKELTLKPKQVVTAVEVDRGY